MSASFPFTLWIKCVAYNTHSLQILSVSLPWTLPNETLRCIIVSFNGNLPQTRSTWLGSVRPLKNCPDCFDWQKKDHPNCLRHIQIAIQICQRIFQKVNFSPVACLVYLLAVELVFLVVAASSFTDTRVSVSKFSSWNITTRGALNYRSQIGITMALASGLTTGHVPSTVLGLFRLLRYSSSRTQY